jgi:hypothetical protein
MTGNLLGGVWKFPLDPRLRVGVTFRGFPVFISISFGVFPSFGDDPLRVGVFFVIEGDLNLMKPFLYIFWLLFDKINCQKVYKR